MPPDSFWVIFLANLPIVVAIVYSFQKRLVVIGSTHEKEMADKDEQIRFRESLRQEVLVDKAALEKTNREMSTSMNELTTVVKQTLELNDRLLSESLGQRWDEKHDRRTPKT